MNKTRWFAAILMSLVFMSLPAMATPDLERELAALKAQREHLTTRLNYLASTVVGPEVLRDLSAESNTLRADIARLKSIDIPFATWERSSDHFTVDGYSYRLSEMMPHGISATGLEYLQAKAALRGNVVLQYWYRERYGFYERNIKDTIAMALSAFSDEELDHLGVRHDQVRYERDQAPVNEVNALGILDPKTLDTVQIFLNRYLENPDDLLLRAAWRAESYRDLALENMRKSVALIDDMRIQHFPSIKRRMDEAVATFEKQIAAYDDGIREKARSSRRSSRNIELLTQVAQQRFKFERVNREIEKSLNTNRSVELQSDWILEELSKIEPSILSVEFKIHPGLTCQGVFTEL